MSPATVNSATASPQLPRPMSSMSRSWGSVSANVNDDHDLISSLALQHRNGSDASFKVIHKIYFYKIKFNKNINKIILIRSQVQVQNQIHYHLQMKMQVQ